jgi:hypothetical protein
MPAGYKPKRQKRQNRSKVHIASKRALVPFIQVYVCIGKYQKMKKARLKRR